MTGGGDRRSRRAPVRETSAPAERQTARRGGDELPAGADVVVVGAGLVGVTVAARLARSGAEVCVLDRLAPAAGTSSSGEGNILVSDKRPGPELAFALRSVALWREAAGEIGEAIEFEAKGSLVVAASAEELAALRATAEAQHAAGAAIEVLGPEALADVEPLISRDLAGGVFYPEDAQIQPMLTVARRVAELRRAGARVVAGTEVLGANGAGTGGLGWVETSRGRLRVGGHVVNAAGPWSAELARRLGSWLPVRPRRGHVLVTEPLAPVARHKVSEAGYLASVHAGDWAAASGRDGRPAGDAAERGAVCAAVVESTLSGTILIGSSRQLVGFDHRLDPALMSELAGRAIAIFPFLNGVRMMRAYVGFRPASPDGLPIIGPDPAVGGLVHATGHEGAGIGLAEATAELVEAIVAGGPLSEEAAAFAPSRFSTDSSDMGFLPI